MPNATAPVSVGQIVAVGSEPAQIGDEAVVGLGDGHLAVARQDDAVADGPHQVAAARQNHQLGLVAARRHCVAENRSNKNQKNKQTNKQTNTISVWTFLRAVSVSSRSWLIVFQTIALDGYFQVAFRVDYSMDDLVITPQYFSFRFLVFKSMSAHFSDHFIGLAASKSTSSRLFHELSG